MRETFKNSLLSTIRVLKKFLGAAIVFAVVILAVIYFMISIESKSSDHLHTPSNLTPSWTTTIIIVSVMVTLMSLIVFAVFHGRQKTKTANTTATSTTTTVTPAVTVAVKSTTTKKEKNETVWNFWKTFFGLGVAVILAWVIIVVTAFALNITPAKLLGQDTTKNIKNDRDTKSVSSKNIETAEHSVKSQYLTIGSDWVRIPRTSYGTNDWNIQALNLSDRFILYGEIDGQSTGSWDFYGGTLPIADVYYIRCTNRTRTQVIWTDDRQ